MAMKLKTEMAATRERGAMNTDIYTHQYTRIYRHTHPHSIYFYVRSHRQTTVKCMKICGLWGKIEIEMEKER